MMLIANYCPVVYIIIQELVIDVAVVTSSRHADRSCARRFAVAKPRFSGSRSFSMVLSQDCLGLGRPILPLQEGPTCNPIESGDDPATSQHG